MNKAKRPLDLYLLVLSLVSIVAITLRTVALFTEWNSIAMNFDGDLLITIANLLVVLAILFFASYFIIVKKEEKLIASSDSPLTYVPSGMVSVALLFLSVETISNASTAYVASNIALKILTPVIFIFGIVSAISFFLSIFIDKNVSTYKAIFSMALVLFLALFAAYMYFDKHMHPTNSPIKIVDMLAYLFAAIFFLYESRINLGRPLWRPYVIFGLTAALLTAYSSVPTIIYYAVSNEFVSDSVYACVLTLTVSLFIVARVFLTKGFTSEEICDAAKCIEALAAKREEEMASNDVVLTGESNTTSEENEDEESADFENFTMDIPTTDSKEQEND